MSAVTTSRLRSAEIIILVGIGGFAGANLRHFVGTVVGGLGGTLVANVLGCLALGFLVYEAKLVGVLSEETGYVASTGFLSSFTTYSTFALETVQSAPLLGVANITANYALGFVAVLLGQSAAKALEVE